MGKIHVATLVGLVGLPSVAAAADLPSRVAPPVYVPPVPIAFSWTGFYVGGNAGYGFDRRGGVFGPTDLRVPATLGTFAVQPAGGSSFLVPSRGRSNGFVGGGQIGYNYEFGTSGFVLGVEADFDYSDLSGGGNSTGGFGSAVPGGNPRVAPNGRGLGIAPLGTGRATAPGNVAFFNNQSRGPGDFLGTIRGRVGYAFDRVLVYGTGGFAYTNSRNEGTTGGFANGAAVPANFYAGFGEQTAGRRVAPTGGNTSGSLTGYVVGGGIEYAIPTTSVINVLGSSAVTLRVEGLYYDLGHAGGSVGSRVVGVSNTGAAITGSGFTSRDNTFTVVRAGLNFKFGAPVAAPVVARY